MKKFLIALVAVFAVGTLSFATDGAATTETQKTTEVKADGAAPTTETKTEETTTKKKGGKKKKAKTEKKEETTM